MPGIVEIDDTAFQILGAYAVKDREFRAKKAAEEAAEKAKKAAQQQPPAAS